ncbi:porin [Succinatimonas hippei]|uniref:porin n=1 Tax=Succinatimonas hippei TaxID=626938 RepID=UPI00255C51EE|nr:porin [Succinatimonas hippei]
MKKSLLALAVAAVAASSVASAATVYDKDGTSLAVYGRIQGVVYSQDSGKTGNSYGDAGLQGSGRLGFDMRTQLTDGIAGFAKVEWDVADNGERGGKRADDSFNSRYLWVGADFGAFGQLKAGRFEDAVKYVLLPTDIFDDFGCNGQMDNDDKRDGMFMYTWSGYGFTANVTYQTAKDGQQVDGAWVLGADGVSEVKLDINDAYAVSVGYQSPDVLFGPIGVRLGYAHTDFQDDAGLDTNTALYDDYNQYAASLYWGSLNVGPYVGALYQVRDFGMVDSADDYKVQGAEFVVAYGFENGVSLRAGYNWMNYDQDNGADVDAHTIPVIAMYNITPNFRLWAEARFDAGTDDDKGANGKNFKIATGQNFQENVYSVGARYTF